MRALRPCLVALCSVACGAACGPGGCAPKKAPPGAESAMVQDFEASPRIKKWPKDGPGEARISTAWKASGERSLEIGPGVMASFSDLLVADFSPFSVLTIAVHNASPETMELGLELQDDHDDFADRFQTTFGVAPGDTTLELDLGGGLWRGEQNRPYRGSIKTPLDLGRLTRMAFTNRGRAPVFLDAIELHKRPKIEAKGAFAFDFGPSGSQVMAETLGVFDTTLYTPDRGFGLLTLPRDTLSRSMSYPSPLLGDGLDLGRGFRVDLPGGDYLGWIAFERGGFWEGESTGYARAVLSVNGARVHEHDFRPSGMAFFFEDTELRSLDEIEERLIRPAAAVSRFSFHAAQGDNTFTLDTTHRIGPPLRVAGLFLAPDTPEGRAFLDAQDARQSRAIRAAFVPQDRGRRDGGRAAPERDLVALPLPPGAEVFPRDFPSNPGGARFFPKVAAHRQTVAFHIGLYARTMLSIHVEAEALEGPSSKIRPAARVSHGRYLPMRQNLPGPVWLAVNHYRPEPDFEVGPDLSRSILVEYEMPAEGHGTYRGVIKIAGAGVPIEMPIEIHLVDQDLPEIPIPVGLFMNALPFRPGHVGEKSWWALQDDLLREQGRAGLNCLTGGPGLDLPYPLTPESHAKSAAKAYVDLAGRYATIRAVVPYGGFVATLKNIVITPAELQSWLGPLAPPHYLNAYDEPATEEELRRAVDRTGPFTAAGVRTMGFFAGLHGPVDPAPLIDVTFAPAVNVHTRAELEALAGRGKQVFVYNNGMDRYHLGVHLWRNIKAKAAGRLEWIGLFTQGFAFDNLDGREASPSAFLVHEKLGILETPRWLAAREGLFDVRVRLALEAKVPASDPALSTWTMEGYGEDGARFPDAVLDAQRAAMLERLGKAP
ncbi:MAG: hypothetical protein U0359_13290 [Byssovorax sp.]